MRHRILPVALLFFINFSAFSQVPVDTICLLQLNDVYEIGPLSQGRVGGMARVATIIKQHEQRYQTFVVLAGDFVSPSVIGTTRIDGKRVNGRHMVDMMNRVGVDLVTFGNHEFDIPEKDLLDRINESRFNWVSSDVMHKDSTGTLMPFFKDSSAIPTSYLLASSHGQFSIGIISATIPSNKQSWVAYNDVQKSMKKAWKQVRKQADITIALTHLAFADDQMVLHKLKKLRLVMGGHEHEHNYFTSRKAAIAKADANAKSMYRHLVFRDGHGKLQIQSDLLMVDSTVAQDETIAAAVKEWESKAYAAFREAGLEPDAVVYHTKEPLDGTEASVRSKQTNLGNLISKAMLAASPQADAAIFNSGSIRIDDMVDGVITQLDVIRILPFGGKLLEVDLDGALLNQLLQVGSSIKGSGGYLQLSPNLVFDGKNWQVNGNMVDPAKTYKIVSLEFLFSGAEKGLEFLKEGNPGIKSIKRFDAPGDVHTDIRLAVVKYWSTLDGSQAMRVP